jgi:ribosomal protein L32
MDPLYEAVPMSKTSRQRKRRSDVKLTPDKLGTIEACLKHGMTHDVISAITDINRSTIAAVRLVLAYVGRL